MLKEPLGLMADRCYDTINADPQSLLETEGGPIGATADFEGLRQWLNDHTFEGIVWHHPDGRMAKIKKRDFPKEST